MDSYLPPLCIDCIHYLGVKEDQSEEIEGISGAHCEAFPAGIPMDIIERRRDHVEPYPGDHGIQLEPKEEEHERL